VDAAASHPCAACLMRRCSTHADDKLKRKKATGVI
jgi:hypothetical protein